MKIYHLNTLAAAAIAALSFTHVPHAMARDVFSFSFNTDAVAFAYTDGYWDHNHVWHKWHSTREAREYRAKYSGNYKASRHTREHNQGWRDQDRDGVPNRQDKDRDGDGVTNQRDRAPDNARRQ